MSHCSFDIGFRYCSLQADEATAADLQRQQNEAAEDRHFEALQSKFGMGEKVRDN